MIPAKKILQRHHQFHWNSHLRSSLVLLDSSLHVQEDISDRGWSFVLVPGLDQFSLVHEKVRVRQTQLSPLWGQQTPLSTSFLLRLTSLSLPSLTGLRQRQIYRRLRNDKQSFQLNRRTFPARALVEMEHWWRRGESKCTPIFKFSLFLVARDLIKTSFDTSALLLGTVND